MHKWRSISRMCERRRLTALGVTDKTIKTPRRQDAKTPRRQDAKTPRRRDAKKSQDRVRTGTSGPRRNGSASQRRRNRAFSGLTGIITRQDHVVMPRRVRATTIPNRSHVSGHSESALAWPPAHSLGDSWRLGVFAILPPQPHVTMLTSSDEATPRQQSTPHEPRTLTSATAWKVWCVTIASRNT
jgi:hypothetical protein